MRKTFLVVLVLSAAPGALAEKKPLTIDDIWAVKRVSSPAVSNDGRHVVYTVSAYDPVENKMNADVFLQPLSGGEPRRLTSHKASDSSPQLSPDGKTLLFVSARDGDKQGQLYLLPLDGGEPERVTDLPLAVKSPRWFPDGSRIAFVTHVIGESLETTKAALKEREKSKVKIHVTENRLYRHWDRWLTDDEYPHLFVLDVKTRKLTDLLPGSTRYFELREGSTSYDIAPDGSSIVFVANASEPPYRTMNYDVFLVPTTGGAPRNLTADSPGEDKSPVFSPDGRTIAFGYEKRGDGWPDRTRLALLDVATGKTTTLTEGWDASPSGWQFTKDGATLVFSAEMRARTNLYGLGVRGGTPTEIFHGGNAAGVVTGADGEMVFLHSTISRPPELHTVKLDGTARALTHHNDELVSNIAWGEVQDLTFKGAANEDVQMYVVLPPGHDKSRRYPLIQLVHGGPVGTFDDSFSFRWNAQAFAAPGYVVAMVNFHGSSSFGQGFLESIQGAHPDKPFVDVMKATDLLIAKGLVDEKRMAAAGGSYGGFLVNWIAGHTDRFAALVSHAGVYSLLGQSASDDSYGRQHSYGGTPWSGLANVEKWSPNRFAAGFKTPMLVLHGEKDYRVPVTQGLELYGVLTAKGVPARLVIYPEENHWVLSGQNAKKWYAEVLGWLDRWLK